MARQEEPREDLLGEATALVERGEFRLPGAAETLVIGFRLSGAGSIFVGDDTVYQFNPRNELRRGLAGGRLIKAEAGRLVALVRQREADRVFLVRHEFSPEETTAYCADCQRLLADLGSAFTAGRYELLRQQPPEANVAGRVAKWLASFPAQVAIASSPHAGG